MTAEVFFARLEILATLAFVVWFIYGPWQQLVIDVTRHELFKIRHRLFWLAADGKVDFNSPEYFEVRQCFNRYIRFCHKITFPRLVAIIITQPAVGRVKIADTLGRVKDPAVRHEIERQWRKSADFVLLGIVLRSPLLTALVMLAIPFAPVLALMAVMDRTMLRNRYKIVLRGTVEHGIELEACRRGEYALKPAFA